MDIKIPYHLIDIAAPGYKYNVFEYQQDFLVSYETVKQKGCLPVLCGGTGMYLESVLKGYKLMARTGKSGVAYPFGKLFS